MHGRGAGNLALKIYALNLFNVANKAEYLAYSKRSAQEVKAHGDRLDDLRPIFK